MKRYRSYSVERLDESGNVVSVKCFGDEISALVFAYNTPGKKIIVVDELSFGAGVGE